MVYFQTLWLNPSEKRNQYIEEQEKTLTANSVDIMKKKFPNIWKVNTLNTRKHHFSMDTDRDGVLDYRDCRPFNPRKQHVDVEESRMSDLKDRLMRVITQEKKGYVKKLRGRFKDVFSFEPSEYQTITLKGKRFKSYEVQQALNELVEEGKLHYIYDPYKMFKHRPIYVTARKYKEYKNKYKEWRRIGRFAQYEKSKNLSEEEILNKFLKTGPGNLKREDVKGYGFKVGVGSIEGEGTGFMGRRVSLRGIYAKFDEDAIELSPPEAVKPIELKYEPKIEFDKKFPDTLKLQYHPLNNIPFTITFPDGSVLQGRVFSSQIEFFTYAYRQKYKKWSSVKGLSRKILEKLGIHPKKLGHQFYDRGIYTMYYQTEE
jgi:hypothetical protein